MRSLFFRIFVSFWIAMTLISAGFGLIYLTISTEDRWERWQYLHEHALSGLVELERAALEGDPKRLLPFGAELARRTRLRVTVLGPDDDASPLPEAARDVVAAARASGARARETLPDNAYFAEPLDGNAAGHVLLAELERPSTLLWFINAETLPGRLLVIFSASGLVCYLLARHLTHRLRVIRRGSRRLAEGDLSARIRPLLGRGYDEADALAEDLDRMAERIAGLLGAQQRLLRDVSHELRSPLTRLSLALELARQSSGAEREEHHARIQREADRLAQLIGEVLTLSRMESGADHERPSQPIDLSELIVEIVRDADFEARPQQREVKVLAEDRLTVIGYAEVLRGAVENVVRNAVRFAPTDTAVEVRLERSHDGDHPAARISVRDHGPGVPESALESIFQPFYRVSGSRTRQSGGIGIGLAITERAVRLHGGHVSAANADGGGLLVTITLPLAEVAVAAQ